jgi:hypothetical protein
MCTTVDYVSKFHSDHVSKDLCDGLQRKIYIFYFGLLQVFMTTSFLKLEIITVFVIHGSLLLIGWDSFRSIPMACGVGVSTIGPCTLGFTFIQ